MAHSINQETETPTTPLLRRNGWSSWFQVPSTIKLKTTLSSELSGAVGDLGTYIPIVLALSLVNSLDLTTTLVFTALYNIATGLLFGLPMPVQPMKSIAAVAISESPPLSIPQIAAAGLSVAAVLLILGATGLMSFLYRYLPLPVVRGVQLSQGLSFAMSAIKYIRYQQDLATQKSGEARPWLALDGLVVALAATLFLILTTGAGVDDHPAVEDTQERESETDSDSRNKISQSRIQRRVRFLSNIPSALLVFLFGLVICFISDPSIFGDLKFGPSKIGLIKITWEDLKIGFFRAAIPQIPLSVLNSVIAVCKLSGDLFPGKGEASVMKVSVSVGLMNFVGCWFGAMPCCHGAGGLAGQYRFGGRSGASVVFLGLAKLVLALVFGNSFGRILGQFPIGILGVLLLFAGIELAMASRDMNSKQESFVMFVCAAVSLTGSSSALGFIVGIVLYLLLKFRELDCGACFGGSSTRKVKDEEASLIG
ncbi:CCR4-NOT core ubiquitin-protein ligase subunit mot2 [Stylosanthes scabra]|uniref:CCR4-NOT core ubiquitin-protein ligase subunit mot2 n=1 Tax=Stylosanthes scabra TaxID=79078 RepID=A0ABU6R9F9_9FABA|nr:CCR4-NOT core ubiquitin-protein ligase subunit mot2 [Stylosanthes scabra]